MLTLEPGELLVARMWQWDVQRLTADAETSYADQVAEGEDRPEYSVSSFATELRPGETLHEAKKRLADAAHQNRRTRWIVFTSAARLEDAGFPVRLSEPPPQHYDVVLGTELEAADVVPLESVFRLEERERLPYG